MKKTTKKLSRNLAKKPTTPRTAKPSRSRVAARDTASGSKSHRGATPARSVSNRAKELARIARDLDQHKSVLAYGEFEKWALNTYKAFPIQVLRYLRKAHRTFGKDLERLFDRYGQKKVFLLLGLDDPWAPVRQGVTLPGLKGLSALDTLSVKQLREAVRDQIRTVTPGRQDNRAPTLLGGLSTVYDRLSNIWPRLRNAPVITVAGARGNGTRQRLERFRTMLEEVLGKIDQVLEPVHGTRAAAQAGRTGRVTATTRTGSRKSRGSLAE